MKQIDAQLVVLDADVHVHAADDEPAADAGEVLGNGPVAFAVGRLLDAPARKGMGRGGDGCQVVLAGHLRLPSRRSSANSAPAAPGLRCTLVPTSICDFRNSRATWSPSALLAAFEQQLCRHLAHEIAAGTVDEEVFLLDADGEGWVLQGHGGHGGTIGEARVAAPRRALGEAG